MSLVTSKAKYSHVDIKQKFTLEQSNNLSRFRILCRNNTVAYNIVHGYTLNHPYFHEIILGLLIDPGFRKGDFNKILIRITSYIRMDSVRLQLEVKKLNHYRKLIDLQIKNKQEECRGLSFSKRCLGEGKIRSLDDAYYLCHRCITILECMIQYGYK